MLVTLYIKDGNVNNAHAGDGGGNDIGVPFKRKLSLNFFVTYRCNGSNFGILRYYSTKLQLCTPHGWQYLLFEPPAGCSIYPDVVNVPETNYQTFRNADLGIMFEFNRKFVPSVISRANLNITAGNNQNTYLL